MTATLSVPGRALGAMILAIVTISGAAQDRPVRLVASAKRVQRPLRLDGDLTLFRRLPAIRLNAKGTVDRARTATIFLGWDNRFLYLAFHVFSPGLQATVREHDGDNLWKDDGVEFLIDATRHRTKQFLPTDFSYHINILNAVYDDRGTPAGTPDERWNGSAQHFVKIISQHEYVIEAAVPWREIGLAPAAGTQLDMDFCVNGRNPHTAEYEYMDWAGLTDFHDPSGYGRITLTDNSRARD